ncbi:DUF742 domain-containing protein [Streptomyces sp. HNM0574]|uniref:DUF742 domain-containing protein n=1 Tax=Streptomyces sp. HNM0574 TaxID=2714954 RepID=UPI00146AC806|nr:DUF742 domain-containing protein [Streptomyces sp. HNM0574]NLU69357.1 DUF742 domain-containing protein [Streptomyces sp. HNM0574]
MSDVPEEKDLEEQQENWEEGGPERLYVVTSGRSQPTERATLDLVTLIVTRGRPSSGTQPEHAAIIRMCNYPLSVAEISAYLHLPASTVTVLLADLLDGGHVEARAPIPTSSLPDVELLEAVMHGLQNL